jgi:hypothetical protein
MKTILTTVLVMLITTTGFASIQFGQATYGGSGCPAGSIGPENLIVSDEGYVSLEGVFDIFAENGMDRRFCQIAIPMSIETDSRLVAEFAFIDGFVENPGSKLNLNFDVWTVGSERASIEADLSQQDGEFLLHSEKTVLRECGENPDTILRMNASVFAKNASASIHRMAVVIKTESCP